MATDDRYILTTPPMEFISDVYDIMVDGDNLTPEKLVADIVSLLRNYISNHNKSLEWVADKTVAESHEAVEHSFAPDTGDWWDCDCGIANHQDWASCQFCNHPRAGKN